MTLVLPGHHQEMVPLFPTGTKLILVTQVLTLASSVQGDSGSSWASPVTDDSILRMASPDLVTVVPMGPHLDLMSLVPPGPHQDLVHLVPTWVASGYGYPVHYQ